MDNQRLLIKSVNVGGIEFLNYQREIGDITIQLEKENFRVDRNVLVSRSGFFKSIQSDLRNDTIFLLKGLSVSDLENLLVFMYQGRIELPIGIIPRFIETIKMFEVDCDNVDQGPAEDDGVVKMEINSPGNDGGEKSLEKEKEADDDDDIVMIFEANQPRQGTSGEESKEQDDVVQVAPRKNSKRCQKQNCWCHRQLKCKKCESILGCTNALKKHIERMHGPKYNSVCLICPKTFCQKFSLVSHFERMHRQINNYKDTIKFIWSYDINKGPVQTSNIKFE